MDRVTADNYLLLPAHTIGYNTRLTEAKESFLEQ